MCIVKLDLQGYTLFFLFRFKNIDCGYTLQPPLRGSSNDPTIYVLSGYMKNIRIWSENFQFGAEIFNIFELACFVCEMPSKWAEHLQTNHEVNTVKQKSKPQNTHQLTVSAFSIWIALWNRFLSSSDNIRYSLRILTVWGCPACPAWRFPR